MDDPDDNAIIDCAVVVTADVIVSGDAHPFTRSDSVEVIDAW